MNTDAAPQVEREVAWQDLAALLATHDLTPGYSQSTGRAYVEHDGALVWAPVGAVRLDEQVPGANRIQYARLSAHAEQTDAEDEAYLASLTDEKRARELEARRRSADMPDPPGWQIDLILERQGRL